MRPLACLEPDARVLAEQVAPHEYARLLLLPRHKLAEGDLAERARDAREWYAAHGRPWIAARTLDVSGLDPEGVTMAGGAVFRAPELARRLREGDAHALVALAVTAGAEAEAEARRRWADGRPDEGFFLDRFAAAVAEHLVRFASVWVCRASEAEGETALFHLSPGCGGWPLEEQAKLMGLLAGGPDPRLGPLHMLPSGMLIPGPSLLAVLGLTRRHVAPTPADACRECDLTPCAFRRAGYRRTA